MMKFKYRHICYIFIILGITACTSVNPNYQKTLERKNIRHISTEHYQICHGFGCRKISNLSLSKAHQHNLKKLFKSNKNAESERELISISIGRMEQWTGAITGTSEDVGGTYTKLGDKQFDCVDESFNTTTYLALLNELELLKYHDIHSPTSRVPPFSPGMPHQTAIIMENETSTRYAVDSWFHDNGQAAEIVLLEKWKFGWKPEGQKKESVP